MDKKLIKKIYREVCVLESSGIRSRFKIGELVIPLVQEARKQKINDPVAHACSEVSKALFDQFGFDRECKWFELCYRMHVTFDGSQRQTLGAIRGMTMVRLKEIMRMAEPERKKAVLSLKRKGYVLNPPRRRRGPVVPEAAAHHGQGVFYPLHATDDEQITALQSLLSQVKQDELIKQMNQAEFRLKKGDPSRKEWKLG